MGARGIKRRKPYHRLPSLRGHVLPAEPEPSPWTPMGVVGAYGKIARALTSGDRQQRRAGRALGLLVCVALVVGLIGLARH